MISIRLRNIFLLPGLILLVAGSAGFVIPVTFMPAKVDVLIFSGCDLQIIQEEEFLPYRSVSAGCLGEFNNEAYIADSSNVWVRWRGIPVVMGTFMFGTHNLTLYVWCGFGANYDRSLRDPRDIEIHNYPVFWRVVLEKDGLKREIMNASGESGSINF